MKVDKWLSGFSDEIVDVAQSAEREGTDCLWITETGHDPFLPLLLIAEHTDEIEFGTRIATAFSRSPMVIAQSAWDLARYSDGRFTLGLGTQVRAHNMRRFSVDFDEWSPGPRLREVIESVRHIWDVWQYEDVDLDYEGEFYSFDLMSEYFDPGPIDNPDIPIYISAVNEYNIKLAGELCDGLSLHPFNSPSYIENEVQPWVKEGARRGDRSPDECDVAASPFLITGKTDEDIEESRQQVRQRVAFYASTPSYRPVMEHHGWVETGKELHKLSKDQDWEAMAELVDDEMLYTFAVEAKLDDLEDEVKKTFSGIADRVVVSPDRAGELDIADGLYVKL